MVDVALMGKEGCNGSSVVQGSHRAAYMAMVQISGTAVSVPTSVVIEHLPRLGDLRTALDRYNALLMQIVVLSVGCSQFHSPPQRLARWIKAHAYRTGIEALPFSEDFLAVQAEVDPKTTASTLDDFEQQGIVSVGHNNIVIADHEALLQQAGPCFAWVKEATDEYLTGLEQLMARSADSQQ